MGGLIRVWQRGADGVANWPIRWHDGMRERKDGRGERRGEEEEGSGKIGTKLTGERENRDASYDGVFSLGLDSMSMRE